ncbi:MAG: FtsQ-type POTRA domain-containing protein [Oscillatoriales cyanobacterium SM2_2_1]|nr:FtsQ-type POTRA domain-containing protein [Oscillatoriales cyanobacterium SM2_2_1]
MSTRSPVPLTADPPNYAEKRRQLRQERRRRLQLNLWQCSLMVGISLGTLWVSALPMWLVQDLSQIEIEGNQLLSKESIKKRLALPLPQSIFQIQPDSVAQSLEQSSPIRRAYISRALFPSRLLVQVHERIPVATSERGGKKGYLDAEGIWMPESLFDATLQPPELEVLESTAPIEPQIWSSLYQQIRRTKVRIRRIDIRDRSNIFLLTDVAPVRVRIGIYKPSQFQQQLLKLDEMRQLQQKFAASQLDSKVYDCLDVSDQSQPPSLVPKCAGNSPPVP